jgi:Fe-S oxidoreductase
MKEEYHPLGDEVGTVGLLLGCSLNLSTPWIADAVIKLLTTAGWRVVVPREQVCCGAPAINNGAWDIARRLARTNLKIFNNLGVECITSADGTCAGAFKHDYREIFRDEPEMLPDVERLSHATTDLSIIIAEAFEIGRIQFSEQPSIIALHDSCHITHFSMGNRWREILGGMKGIEMKKLPDSDHCCGFGGSYAFLHSETSFKIAARKAERAMATGADELLVGSPGCLMRLQSVVNERHSGKLRIRHVVEFLQDRLKPT